MNASFQHQLRQHADAESSPRIPTGLTTTPSTPVTPVTIAGPAVEPGIAPMSMDDESCFSLADQGSCDHHEAADQELGRIKDVNTVFCVLISALSW